jgi:O-antigen ligase
MEKRQLPDSADHMFSKNSPTPSSFLANCAAPFFLLLSVFLASSSRTIEVEDPKYIFAFLCFPLLFLVAAKNEPFSPSGGKSWTAMLAPPLFFAFVAYTLGNWYFLSNPYFGVRSMAYEWFCFLSFLLGTFLLSRPGAFTAFCTVCIVTGAVASLYGAAEFLAIIPYFQPESWPPRITGLLAHKNPFAFFLMNSTIWTGVFLLRNHRKKPGVILALALAAQLCGLLISDCRGVLALFAVGSCAALLPLVLKKGLLRRKRARYFLYGAVFLCILIPLLIWNDYFWARIASLTIFSDQSADTRLALYQAEWKLFLAHPVFGCGVGNFVYENIPFLSESFRKTVSAFFFALNAESDYLETLTETGLLGFGFYCFFLFGAVFLGIRQLRREWKWDTYIVLVLTIIMLINGLYDTPIRRLPCAIVFWGYIGYLWRGPFAPLLMKNSSKKRLSVQGIALMIHCIIAVFFFRILLGDYYYMQSFTTMKNPSPQSGKQVKRALDLCPFHPDALYQAAYIAIRTGQLDFALRLADHLDQTAPHYRPTGFIRGLCALERKHYGDALAYAAREESANPNFIDNRELKIKALAGLGKCGEVSRLQIPYRIYLRDEEAFKLWGDTITSSSLKKMYIDQTGKIRALTGGSFLREAYRRYIAINRKKGEGGFAQARRITSVTCEARKP